ncbi:hypothetical protein [Photobacterium kishitanii]|uniref:Uncharacterized protein n=1 Tax=Photobacterium kishitanii TaxID=318456 RepID=A0A2T3KKY2_9GAMM|nr:hypothetical protein [Photobacterium kishitanii]PSV00310.1 hypothetical protein C9J27_04080 [Photobacterium kishitanii]
MANWTKPRSKSEFISLLRNQVVFEQDSTVFYKHLPVFHSVHELKSGVAKYGSNGEAEVFNNLLDAEGDNWCYPVMGTVHNYLRKHDAEWYYSQEAFKN